MTDDQITELARLLPPEAAPDLPADRLQILKEHLMLEYQRAAGNRRPTPPRRRVRRPLIAALGAGAALAAVAATAIALVVSGGQPAPASPAAVELAREGRQRRRPAARTRREQWRVHVRQERRLLRRLQQRQPEADHGAAARTPDLAAGGQHLRLGAGDRGRSADLARALARQRPVLLRQVRPQATWTTPPTGCCSRSRPTRARCSTRSTRSTRRTARGRHSAVTARPSSRSETSSARRSRRRRPPPRCTGRPRSSPA